VARQQHYRRGNEEYDQIVERGHILEKIDPFGYVADNKKHPQKPRLP
jgi:hypothetical protein